MTEWLQDRPASLRDYLEILLRRKWVLLIAVAVVPAVAWLLSANQASRYEATARVLVNPQNLAANLENIQDPAQYDRDRNLRTQVELARVPAVARRTLDTVGLESWDSSKFFGMSSVSAGAANDILTFAVTYAKPEVAATLATEYARQYIRYRRELDTGSLNAAKVSVERRIASLRKNGDVDSPLFAILLERQQQLEILETLQTARAVLIRQAAGATRVQPQPRRDAMLGAVLGLLLGVGLIVLLEALDSRVRSSGAVAHRLGLRLLARIPPPPREVGDGRLVMLEAPNSPGAEAFRMLATNLEFTNIEEGARTIMVTSAVEGEGKSTTIANLGIALARAGRRVILVDLDLRSASLHGLFDIPQTPGLTDVVLRAVDMERALTGVDIGSPRTHDGWALQRVSEGRLEVLCTGRLVSAPGDFVARIPIFPMLDYLKDRCDIVLIDGPPVLQVGDAMVLSPAVDAIIVVARLNVVRVPMLNDLDRVLRDCPAPVLGLAITNAETEVEYGYRPYPRDRKGLRT